MATHLAPYLTFPGNRTTEAFTFYAGVFGGTPQFLTAAQMPMGEGIDPDAVMHAALETPQGMHLYATDMVPDGAEAPANGELAIMTDEAEAGRRWFDALAEGGRVVMPMEPQEWGAVYGQLLDRFGVSWAINISEPEA